MMRLNKAELIVLAVMIALIGFVLFRLTRASFGDEVAYMHTDSDGITQLIDQLTRLKEKIDSGENDHLYFMTEDWGGNELTNQPQAEGGSATLVHHLKIFGWTEEKRKTH